MTTSTETPVDYSKMEPAQMIVASLNLFCGDRITEIRCLGARGINNQTDSGYFDDFSKARNSVMPYVMDNRSRGVYFVFNEVHLDLLARSVNRMEARAKFTTTDDKIISRRWLFVDFDPIRPSGISSTDDQVEMAVERARNASEWMRSQGLCEPILAMSGNGAHLHFPVLLPNNTDSTAIVSGVLKTLQEKFSDDAVGLDTTVSNPARICRLYGTIARKGDSTADRPHRMAAILYVPDYLRHRTGDVCDAEALRTVAAMSQTSTRNTAEAPTSSGISSGSDARLIVDQYLQDHGIAFKIERKGEYTNYVLNECLFNPDHKSPDAFITQGSRGGVRYKCSHNSCAHYDWHAVKLRFQPKPEHWRKTNAPTRNGSTGSVQRFFEGECVRAGDRDNFGTVVHDDGGSFVTVHFIAKDGAEATKEIPRALLKSTDGEETEQYVELVFHDGWKAAFDPKKMRECIIEGLLRRGEVGNVIASTKAGKSWFGVQLLMSVATGREWLGMRVARGKVLLIDNELHEETIENRLSSVRERMNIQEDTTREAFDYLACRGDWVSLKQLVEDLPKKYPPGTLNLIVIDAKYRLFGNGLEENSNDDQTTFHNMIDKLAKEMNCAILLVHHATKGDQSGKSVTDIGSGGGSQSRAVDLHMTIRPHKQPGLAVLEAAVRSFAPVEPVTLRWNWPTWSADLNTKPELQKNSKVAARTAEMRNSILEHISKDWMSESALAARCGTQRKRPVFEDVLDDLEREGIVERRDDFTAKNSKKQTEGIRLSSDKTTSDTV